MEQFFLGSTIRQLRQKKKLTLEELAEGICSKRQLQRIETNITVPSADIILLLSKKLNENIQDYLPYSDYENPIEIAELNQKLENLFYLRDYKTLFDITSNYLDTHDSIKNELRQLIGYYYGSCHMRLPSLQHPEPSYYESLLQLTLDFNNEDDLINGFRSIIEYKLISSLLTRKYFYRLNEKSIEDRNDGLRIGLVYLKQLIYAYSSTYKNLDCNFISRLYNNVSHAYYILGEYEEALNYADEALEQYTLFSSMSVIGMLHYVKGNALVGLNRIDEAKKHFRYFIKLHELIDETEYVMPLIIDLTETYELSN